MSNIKIGSSSYKEYYGYIYNDSSVCLKESNSFYKEKMRKILNENIMQQRLISVILILIRFFVRVNQKEYPRLICL